MLSSCCRSWALGSGWHTTASRADDWLAHSERHATGGNSSQQCKETALRPVHPELTAIAVQCYSTL